VLANASKCACMQTPIPAWDLLLRGVVAGVLAFHVLHLALPGPLRPVRLALIAFALSLLPYLLCQRADLMSLLPPTLAWCALGLCTSGTLWLWLASRALFDDRFAWRPSLLALAAGMVALGFAAHSHHLLGPTAIVGEEASWHWVRLHQLAQLVLIAATVWEVTRGWRDDLVAPRRIARRWVAMAVAAYAAVVLVVEVAIEGQPAGPWLPALHVAGIGCVAMALALLVAKRSLDVVLGLESAPSPTQARPPDASAAQLVARRARPPSVALQGLQRSMDEERLYRQEGLTLDALARRLGQGEAALRALINQELGYRSFNDFLHHYRLLEASARLVAEDRPVLSIALECGYGSIGPFNRAFKQRFGVTPTAYRAAARLAGPAPTN
jgi:AraC-like DNA-binding protein